MDWPHAPVHRLGSGGMYMVTCGTYRKEHFFRGGERLSILNNSLIEHASQCDWRLQAWAVFSNHYHFVAMAPENGSSLSKLLGRLHMVTAKVVNELDDEPGRKVWFQYWDTKLTYEKSYFARLHYVQNNPVKHGIVPVATQYQWCSAGWFEQNTDSNFYKTIMGMNSDSISVRDDF